MAANADVVSFLYSWQQLDAKDKSNGLDAFADKPMRDVATASLRMATDADLQVGPTTTYDGVQLYSSYNYLYYYPTMHWHLDQTPETDDYWVGIFPKEAKNTEYITYQWLKKTAQGSYKIGKLKTNAAGVESRERFEEFELRLFKGDYQCIDAVTNVLRGTIEDSPTDPDEKTRRAVECEQLDPETREFVQAIQTFESLDTPPEATHSLSLQDLCKKWDAFTPLQKQLLLPVLEQEALPDHLKRADPKALPDRPEPKIYFPDLGNVEALEEAQDPKAPNKIVLSITLNSSYTYIYPVVNVVEGAPPSRAWMGVYYTQSNTYFDPKSYIDNDWQWVGPGEEGKTDLNSIKESSEGPMKKQYLGVIFKGTSPDEQIGLASLTIAAAITTTAAAPPPDFEPDFDKPVALRYAQLSQLAYKPYSTVKQELSKYDLLAEMQIHDSRTDTNGFIASNGSSVVVAFRGTDIKSWQNIFTDAWFFRKLIIPGQEPLAHGGFVDAINSVFQPVASKLEKILGKKTLVITGHSLGGALASLLTYRMSPSARPTMYVYGCPPVGDITFATYFKCMDTNTITIQNDPVSSGHLIMLGNWAGLYKPVTVKYLPKAAGHGIGDYIEQLENIE